MAELTDMSLDRLEQHQAELWRLHFELTDAAMAGDFQQAGAVYGRICQAQHDAGLLPGRPELKAIRDELAALDKIPGRVLGVSRG